MISRIEIYAPPALEQSDWESAGYESLEHYVESLDRENQKLAVTNPKVYASIKDLPLVSFWYMGEEKEMVLLCNDYSDLPTESLIHNGINILTFK